ncbi:MAG TPA: hypothetical protein VFK40_15030 [Nitrososphaeraceae archaeon]|nr:hypothetical protein [Nitrososphaeraceae archaeon]
MSSHGLSFAQKNDNDKKDDDKDGNDKLVVKTRIHLDNLDLENTKFFRVVGFINGQDVKQDIPISSIDKTKNILSVDLKVDKNTEIVEADTPDEFFVCAYQVGKLVNDYNSFTGNFDCNESDLVNIDKPTVINLFRPGSAVYSTSKAVYDKSILNKNPNSANNNNPVKIKISAPLSDKKDTEKLVIGVMIKGQIQSEVIENVQDRLEKSDDNTISKIFTFDRKTDIGPIQIGDRFHACVASDDLSPPEGSECEKRIIKNLDKVSGLYAR